MKKDISIILNNIRSVHNVGAIFRTADAVGISKIYITGYTPTPVDRFGRNRDDLHKSALGAEKNIKWEYVEKVEELINDLKKEGTEIIALEQSPYSKDYKDVEVSDRAAVLIGNEVTGVPEDLLSKCDVVVEIPMEGKKESLNVSVATGVLLYRLLNI
jgi:23S rRNA (guanosine2251-2'-O)-methyltransferase